MEPTQSNWWWYGRWLYTDCNLFIVCIHLTWILTSFCLYRSLSSYLTLRLHEARENGDNVIEPDKLASIISFALWERNLWFLQSMQCDILGHLVFPIHTWMQCWSKCTRLKDANSRLVLIASQNGHSPQKVDHNQMTSDKGIDFLLHNLVYVRIVSSIWTSCKKMRFDLALFLGGRWTSSRNSCKQILLSRLLIIVTEETIGVSCPYQHVSGLIFALH